MKFKKFIAIALSAAMVTSVASMATGCKKEAIVNDGKTVNVRLYKAGYGDEYMTAWANAFSELYAEEGYKINVVEATTTIQGVNVTNELTMKEKNGIDLYLAGQISNGSIASVSNTEGFVVAEDLTDLMQLPAIGKDGKEESVKIIDKLKAGTAEELLITSDDEKLKDYKNKWYAMPYMHSVSGLVVNVPLLTSYELEIPLTTGDLLNCFKVINEKNATVTGDNKVYPTVWAGDNAYRYLDCTYATWFAQYSGLETFNKWRTFNGTNSLEEILAIYDDKGLELSVELMNVLLDLKNAPSGTISMAHGLAQHQLLSDKAVFMANGNWLQNEMGANYKQKISDMKMIKMPIISELGVKIGLGADVATAEPKLKEVIKLIDEGKTDEQIVQTAGVTADQAKAVRDARSIYYGGIGGAVGVINPFSPVKDVAKLFLRFIASDDAAVYFRMFAAGTTCFEPTDPTIYDQIEQTAFLKSCNEIMAQEGAVTIGVQPTSGSVKAGYNLAEWNTSTYSAVDWFKVMAQQGGELTAAELIKTEKETIEKKIKEFK